MSTTTVTTQAELDAALTAHRDDPDAEIYIDSPAGVWLDITDTGQAYVEACGSASVRAWGSASVRAWDSASVSASKYVSVHLHSTRVTLDGGVVIDMISIDETDPVQWTELRAEVVDGEAVLYKAVRNDLRSAHGFAYPIGETVACTDWHDDGHCGGGLHFSPHPWQASEYDSQATRFLEVRVPVAELRPLDPDKCKAPGCRVVREVNVHGVPVEASAVTA